jgi:hypothetical protein
MRTLGLVVIVLAQFSPTSVHIEGGVTGYRAIDIHSIFQDAGTIFKDVMGREAPKTGTLHIKQTTMWNLQQKFPKLGLVVATFNRPTDTIYVTTEVGDVRCNLFHEMLHFMFQHSGLSDTMNGTQEHAWIHQMEYIYNPACDEEDWSW